MRYTLTLLVLTSCLAMPVTAQQAIILVRHAEKVDSSQDAALSEAGRARASRLAVMLTDAGVDAIYSTRFQRTMRTAEPFATASKVAVTPMPDRVDAFVAEVRANHPNDVVLVVGHSNTIPEIIQALGVKEKVEIGDLEFSQVFIVVPRQAGGAALLQLRY